MLRDNASARVYVLHFRLYLYLPVSFYVFCAIFHISQTFCSVLDKKFLNEIFGDRINMSWPIYLSTQDLFVNPKRIIVKEWRISGQHLVDEDAEGPPVHRLVVALGLDDLRGQVLGGPAQGPRPVADSLGKTEVCYLQVSVPDDIEND